MKKDFITVTPDGNSGNGEITLVADQNTGTDRSTIISVSGGGVSKTLNVKQKFAATYSVDRGTNRNIVYIENQVAIVHESAGIAGSILVPNIEFATNLNVSKGNTFRIVINKANSYPTDCYAEFILQPNYTDITSAWYVEASSMDSDSMVIECDRIGSGLGICAVGFVFLQDSYPICACTMRLIDN